jgi:hypothetical protein
MFFRPLLIPILALTFAPVAFSQGAAPSGGVVPPAPLPGAPRLATPGKTGATLPQDNRSPTPESPLMPDQTPSLVKPEALPGEAPATEAAKKPAKVSKTEVFELDLAQKVRFRQVHTEALADRNLMALWEKANVARKEIEKRTLMKEYYKLLYARMLKIDPSLKAVVELQAVNAEHRLTQVRITPTEAADEGERSTSGRVFSD